jgi:hypothetical protein
MHTNRDAALGQRTPRAANQTAQALHDDSHESQTDASIEQLREQHPNADVSVEDPVTVVAMKLDPWRRANLMRLLETTPWGDIAGAIQSFETSIRRAMEVTVDDFRFWEEHSDEAGFDEFLIEPWQAEAMTPEWRRAHVARLLRSAALNYGLGTEYGGELGLPIATSRDALAPLLYGLVQEMSR